MIAGIETMHMIKKGQMDCPVGSTVSAADQFYAYDQTQASQQRPTERVHQRVQGGGFAKAGGVSDEAHPGVENATSTEN